jgi:adenylate cyclase class 2
MQTEIEAKFLNVDHSTIRKKLKKVGAVRIQSVRLMRRKNFDFKDLSLEKEKSGWVRVRDEGDKVTLSYKQLNHRG